MMTTYPFKGNVLRGLCETGDVQHDSFRTTSCFMTSSLPRDRRRMAPMSWSKSVGRRTGVQPYTLQADLAMAGKSPSRATIRATKHGIYIRKNYIFHFPSPAPAGPRLGRLRDTTGLHPTSSQHTKKKRKEKKSEAYATHGRTGNRTLDLSQRRAIA